MKVLISVDIEGIAGVFHPEQTRAGNAEYEQARRWMTREANAAAQGAFDGLFVWGRGGGVDDALLGKIVGLYAHTAILPCLGAWPSRVWAAFARCACNTCRAANC